MEARRSTPDRSLRIALLHPCYWPEVRRGSERFIHDLGKRLAERKHHPYLVTSHPGKTSLDTEDGIDVLRLHRPRGRRFQLGLRDQYLTHVPATLRALGDLNPDVVHALYPVDAVAASRWCRRAARPLVFSLMGMPRPEALRRMIWRRVVAAALSRADVSVSLSRRAADLTEEAFTVRPRVIHPGVDLGVFDRAAPRAPVPTILCPADLRDPRKRGTLLLEAFARLREDRQDARLVLSKPPGANPPAADGVEYRDLDSHDALARAYSEAWLTVLLSEAEAFGLVLVESLACGTPVLGTRGGGAEEIIDAASVGRLVAADNASSIAAAIADSMEGGEEIRPSCRARADAFSADRCAAAYEELYRKVL